MKRTWRWNAFGRSGHRRAHANHCGIVPGAVIAVRPLGVLLMQDEAGADEKIVAVPVSRLTRRYDQVNDYNPAPLHHHRADRALFRSLQ
jgi:inorganic pyrophosphatase